MKVGALLASMLLSVAAAMPGGFSDADISNERVIKAAEVRNSLEL